MDLKMKTKFSTGTIVFAKINQSWWPALIFSSDLINKDHKVGHWWVFWFGDHKISEIKDKNIIKFVDHLTQQKTFFSRCHGKKMTEAIVEALRYYGDPDTQDLNEEELMEWAKNSFNGKTYENGCRVLPEFVIDKLRSLQEGKESTPLKQNRQFGACSAIIEGTCLACNSPHATEDHPLFEGHICNSCKENIKTSFFNIGVDHVHYSCIVCGNKGDLIVCGNEICRKTYSHKCLNKVSSNQRRLEILDENNWVCFICEEDRNLKIKRRETWRNNIICLFDSKTFHVPRMSIAKDKIRVLSVFDGISAGYTALKQLNLNIECYYASEIDTKCINVTNKNYSDAIHHIGDIREITIQKLQEIGPIDLFIGGSPCNELSRVNPLRKGPLNEGGTGTLVFEFIKVLMELKEINNKPFFWLFENVSSMKTSHKNLISRSFGSEPIVLDASWVSPQIRKRYFWGNCPSLETEFDAKGPTLQEYLINEESGTTRIANVDKNSTIASKSNSLLQGPNKTAAVKIKDGDDDKLKIEEIEQIFGFPRKYTMVNEYSDTCRLKLLGRSWSVQMISKIFHFLKYFYQTNYENK